MKFFFVVASSAFLLSAAGAQATSTNNGIGNMSVDQNPRQSITSPSTPTIPRPGTATTTDDVDTTPIPQRSTINDSAPPRWDPAQGEVRDYNSNSRVTSDPSTTPGR